MEPSDTLSPSTSSGQALALSHQGRGEKKDSKQRKTGIAVLVAIVPLICACFQGESPARAETVSIPPATPLASDTDQVTATIRLLEDKVRQNPDDFIAYTKLAGYYLQRQRETGSSEYLDLAGRAARASLAIVPAEQNSSGLVALAQVEHALHHFVAARDHAIRLTELNAQKSIGFQILSDALLELGAYDPALRALHTMQRLAENSTGTQTRLGKYALLRGRAKEAARHISQALVLALAQSPPSRETVAWCRWQLGEIAFSTGNYETAERHYRDALVTFPDYYRALAGLGRARAARGDVTGAIEHYQRATQLLPEIPFVAALGDLYTLAGREQEAAAQYALIEKIAQLGSVSGALYNRALALFYTDHDKKGEEAYTIATKEYEARQDIYGADAVAWTALKAGKLLQAQAAIRKAFQLGTQDARLYYHAGMIARAAGDKAVARDYLKRALKLNPQFDPLQAAAARRLLATID